jgi:hypothetical protein
MTFEQFVSESAEKGRFINTMFEERLFALVGTLERIAKILSAAEIPFELIGGGAVMVHVDRVEPAAVRNTKDVDIMVHRADLERIKEVAQRHGFVFRLIFCGRESEAESGHAQPAFAAALSIDTRRRSGRHSGRRSGFDETEQQSRH